MQLIRRAAVWRRSNVTLLLAGILVVACSPSASGNGTPAVNRSDSAALQPGYLAVANEHGHDVTVFAVLPDTRVRIGRVQATSTRTLVLPQRLEGHSLRFSTRCLADDASDVSRNITWTRGQMIELSIGPDLDRSTVTVR